MAATQNLDLNQVEQLLTENFDADAQPDHQATAYSRKASQDFVKSDLSPEDFAKIEALITADGVGAARAE